MNKASKKDATGFLKPCRNCGVTRVEVCSDFDKDGYYCECPSCEADSPRCETQQDAIDAWNEYAREP